MRPAFKTESNAIYYALTHFYLRKGLAEPTLSQFNARYSVHQNRRGFVLHAKEA